MKFSTHEILPVRLQIASGQWHSRFDRAVIVGLTIVVSVTLAACGGGGSSAATVPTVSLRASPSSVVAGNASTLTWSSTNATSCTASGSWSGSVATSGSRSTGILTATANYALACSGAGGSSDATTSVTVTTAPAPAPAPAVTLSANPASITSGSAATLVWSTTNATSCTASGGWSGTKPTSGSTSTGAIIATTNYSLACTGAGGSKSATATVTVTGATSLSVKPRIAALTLSQTQQFTATVSGGAAASWSVDGVAGGNATVGTISASGLYAPGSAVGTHTIVATSVANSSQSGTASVAVTDLAGVYTHHNDVARTGQNLQEYALTPTVVGGSGNFGKLFQCSTDGTTYAQPLYVANLAIGGGTHNVVFVATEHDSVYAFDADAPSCVTYWHMSFVNGTSITPVPASVPYQSTNPDSQDIQNEIGITGTPVISASANTLYVVAKTQETDSNNNVTYHDRLHALSLATGSEQTNSPVDINATFPTNGGGTLSFISVIENQRPALLLSSYAQGTAVYIAWSSYGDFGAYNGWVIAYDAATLAQVAVWNDTPNGTLGGIWMSGGGIAADSSGALYVSTGNGTFDDTGDIVPPLAPNNDFGESFVKLDPSSLAVTDYYTPSQTAAWTAMDEDLSSSGVTVLPDGSGPAAHPNVFVGSDKQGHLWLMDRELMSRFSPSADNTVQYLTMPDIAACPFNCTYSTPAYYNGTVYIGMVTNPLMAFTLSDGLFNETSSIATVSSMSAETYGYPGPTPMISASAAGNGIVWVLDTSANGSYTNAPPFVPLGPTILRAYDAGNLATTLYSSSTLASDTAGNAVKFMLPVIANGKVYVAGDHSLTVFGLLR